jgi:hypothetical protein
MHTVIELEPIENGNEYTPRQWMVRDKAGIDEIYDTEEEAQEACDSLNEAYEWEEGLT